MTVPYPYQLEGVERIQELHGRCLLADGMGLGKSFQSLLWMTKHLKRGPTVIVCPASLKWNWSREASIHIQHKVHILDGRKPQENYLQGNNRIYVINYDILKDWLDWLKELKPRLIIFDEAHYLQSPRAQRTKAALKLSQGVPHVLALTGTPLTNRPVELWPVLHLLYPEKFPSFFSFAWKYTNPVRTIWGWKYIGAKNLDLLHRTLQKTCMIRRRKEDVLSQLPKKARHVVPLALSNQKEYDHAVTDFLGWLKGKDPSRVRKAAKAEAVTRLSYLKQLAAQLKLPSVMEWVDNFLADSEGKLVLFCTHKAIVKELHDRYAKLSVVVTGSVTGSKRQQAFDQFCKSPAARVLVGNIKAAGVGWNAKGADTVAFAEFAWAPGDHVQAEDRIHGLGRGVEGRQSTAVYLVGKGTIEEDLMKLIRKKWKVIDKVLDGGKDTAGFDIFTEIAKMTVQRSKTH